MAQDLDYKGCLAYKESCNSVFEGTQDLIFDARIGNTRPSVNFAKDRLDQSFLIPSLVRKRILPMDVITIGQSTAIFLCIWPFFGIVTTNWTNNQPNNQVILVQANFWPVRRQSFAKSRLQKVKNLHSTSFTFSSPGFYLLSWSTWYASHYQSHCTNLSIQRANCLHLLCFVRISVTKLTLSIK